MREQNTLFVGGSDIYRDYVPKNWPEDGNLGHCWVEAELEGEPFVLDYNRVIPLEKWYELYRWAEVHKYEI
jgi:hypothetical protein